jgi:hypothetical protein
MGEMKIMKSDELRCAPWPSSDAIGSPIDCTSTCQVVCSGVSDCPCNDNGRGVGCWVPREQANRLCQGIPECQVIRSVKRNSKNCESPLAPQKTYLHFFSSWVMELVIGVCFVLLFYYFISQIFNIILVRKPFGAFFFFYISGGFFLCVVEHVSCLFVSVISMAICELPCHITSPGSILVDSQCSKAKDGVRLCVTRVSVNQSINQSINRSSPLVIRFYLNLTQLPQRRKDVSNARITVFPIQRARGALLKHTTPVYTTQM